MIDLHCDTFFELMRREGEELRENSLCVDLRKLKHAGSMVQMFACFLYAEEFKEIGGYSKAYERALEIITYAKEQFDKNDDTISLVRNWEEVEHNTCVGKMSAILTIEEGGILEGDISRLEHLYQEGIRLMTLTWNYENCIGYPNKMSGGLKSFGIEVVKRMNELGMLIDVSHLSDQGFWDVIEYSSKPIVASHSNARSICNHARNLTDEMIKALAEQGGIAGINFYPYFVRENGVSSADDLAEHVAHMYRVGGEDCIAIGTDFDGFDEGVTEIEHIGEMNLFYEAIKRKGFTERQIEKIWYQNAERLLKDL